MQKISCKEWKISYQSRNYISSSAHMWLILTLNMQICCDELFLTENSYAESDEKNKNKNKKIKIKQIFKPHYYILKR